MKKLIFISAVLSLFFSTSRITHAEFITLEREYTYQASEADSKLSSRIIALEQVKRLLLEELGTYLEGQSEVNNLQLTKDQITTFTAGIVRAAVVDEKWDGKTYYLKAKITANPTDVLKSINALRQDREKTKELEEAKKRTQELLQNIDKLKEELNNAKANEKSLLTKDYAKIVNELSVEDLINQGRVLSRHCSKLQDAALKKFEIEDKVTLKFGEYKNQKGWHDSNFNLFYPDGILKAIEYRGTVGLLDEEANKFYPLEKSEMKLIAKTIRLTADSCNDAIAVFSKVLKLNPSFTNALAGRGFAYYYFGNYQLALKDFNRLLELTKTAPPIYYYFRGKTHSMLKNHKQAIKDFSTAINLESDEKKTRNILIDRGAEYFIINKYQQAIRDADKALELAPGSDAYLLRGTVYYFLGNYQESIRNCNKCIEFDSVNVDCYSMRGSSYKELDDYHLAIADFDRVIELDPVNAEAYRMRGFVCMGIDDFETCINDWKISARLGNKNAQGILRKLQQKW